MDRLIEEMIDIFKLEGVKLVRLSGLTRKAQSMTGKKDLNANAIHSIVLKLHDANVVNYNCILNCPHCGETSYCIEDFNNQIKLCDTCNTIYHLSEGITMQKGGL
ncbi:hypothetical protein D3C81_521460 [compost metagenome]